MLNTENDIRNVSLNEINANDGFKQFKRFALSIRVRVDVEYSIIVYGERKKPKRLTFLLKANCAFRSHRQCANAVDDCHVLILYKRTYFEYFLTCTYRIPVATKRGDL